MIDLDKLPDWMVGTVAAASIWLGFNYVVLAPRAMTATHMQTAIPDCIAMLEEHERTLRSFVPTTGVKELDRLVEAKFPALSPDSRRRHCERTARLAAAKRRFDYAVYTASFRMIAPGDVESFGDDIAGATLDAVYGDF